MEDHWLSRDAESKKQRLIIARLTEDLRISEHDRNQLTARVQDLEVVLARAKRESESIYCSWQRALGNKLFPKRHLIDALVLTTRHYFENYERWKSETERYEADRQHRELAATLGVDPEAFRHNS